MKGLVIVEKGDEGKITRLEQQLRREMGARERSGTDFLWVEKEFREPNILEFQRGRHRHRLPIDRIVYLEKKLRKVEVVMEGGTVVSFYSGMQEVLDQLEDQFCQCHKSYVVNLNQVAALEKEEFRMSNGAMVPISQRRRQEVRWRYEDFQEQKNIENLRFSKKFSCFEI